MRPGVIDPHLNPPLTCTKYPESFPEYNGPGGNCPFPREYTPEKIILIVNVFLIILSGVLSVVAKILVVIPYTPCARSPLLVTRSVNDKTRRSASRKSHIITNDTSSA